MPTAVKSWKFLTYIDGKIVSDHGRHNDRPTVWDVGTWKHLDGRVKPCVRGFHCSDKPLAAFGYVQGSVMARVEVKGTRVPDYEPSDKEAVSDMRIVKAGFWTPSDSKTLAAYVASLTLPAVRDTRKRAAITDALSKVHGHLRTGEQLDVMLAHQVESATRSNYPLERDDSAEFAGQAAYYAVHTCLNDAYDSSSASANGAYYAIGAATAALDSCGGADTFKGSVNEWLENRFKTLTRV